MSAIVQSIVCAVIVAGAVFTAMTRNLVRAIFSMLGTLTAVALIYLLLSADFLAVTQMLVYAGGVMVLFLFAVFSVGSIGDPSHSSPLRMSRWSIALVASLGIFLTIFSLSAVEAMNAGKHRSGPITAALGRRFISEYSVSFELLAVLLLLGLIGVFAVLRATASGDSTATANTDIVRLRAQAKEAKGDVA